jgi:hypothetical protein
MGVKEMGMRKRMKMRSMRWMRIMSRRKQEWRQKGTRAMASAGAVGPAHTQTRGTAYSAAATAATVAAQRLAAAATATATATGAA